MKMRLDIDVCWCSGFNLYQHSIGLYVSKVIYSLQLELPVGAVGWSKLKLVAVELENKVTGWRGIRTLIHHVYRLVGIAGKWYLESENGVLLGNGW
jgi:hypothetical protein